MYDIAIIGGGPAGLAAGLYGARGGMDTVLLFGVAPFLGANALFTTEDNSLGLSPFSSRYANLDGVCFEGLRYYRKSLHPRQLSLQTLSRSMTAT